MSDETPVCNPIIYIKEMKRIFLTLSLALGFLFARADEGMWLLTMMKQQHLDDSLRKAGLLIAPDRLYSEKKSSIRDCIGIFGGGCTGEVVSPHGLVMTNNHCGFGYVHDMSTLEHNYLQDGFFARSMQEELPVPELQFTFVRRIADVTDIVEKAIREEKLGLFELYRGETLPRLAREQLEKSEFSGQKGMRARIEPFFEGNRFYLFLEQVYSDVRLVANPPQNVAQFGFNQDNWIWPRHNADFAVFRIYAAADGQPADYAAENLPLETPAYLPISLDGVGEGDYTMIMGFPGSTSRFLTASQVRTRCESQNAPVALAGNLYLDYLKRAMDADSAFYLKHADEYMSIGNVVKNYGGMNESVRKTGLAARKAAEEAQFRAFARGKARYAGIIERIDSLQAAAADSLYDTYLLRFAGLTGMDISTQSVEALAEALAGGKADSATAKAMETLRKDRARRCKDEEADYYRGLSKLLLPLTARYGRLEQTRALAGTDIADIEAQVDSIFDGSIFRSAEAFEAFAAAPSAEVLLADPLYRYAVARQALNSRLREAMQAYRAASTALSHVYVRGLCEMYKWTKAPDANFTLRMTYGRVADLHPRDAVRYDWQTTLDGMFEKENPDDSDYVINEKLRRHFLAGDYGRYARPDGKLPACFLSNNDITGGNSGSGVLNARGELIGLAFDGNIESLSSDLCYNPELQRCINVDIRFVLFMLDTFGGSTYLLDELDLR